MKYKKGDLILYNGNIFLITDFRPYKNIITNNYNIYSLKNLTTKNNDFDAYPTKYIDEFAEKIG
jgi:hypothetical protein